MSRLKYILFTCPLLLSGLESTTQNLENIGKSNPLKISENSNCGLRFYHAEGISNLGAYFFTNDREQISINTNVSAIDNKLQVSAGSIVIISL